MPRIAEASTVLHSVHTKRFADWHDWFDTVTKYQFGPSRWILPRPAAGVGGWTIEALAEVEDELRHLQPVMRLAK